MRFGYEISTKLPARLIATGETTHVICDRQGRPKSLPEKYRKFFPVDAPPDPHNETNA